MNGDLIGRTAAVHYNFKARKLSLREINPATGRLGRLLGLFNAVSLSDATFTSDERKWSRWVGGDNPHARQFAEIRGVVSALDDDVVRQDCRVIFNPRRRVDFHFESGQTIARAASVAIAGRDISVPASRPS